MPKQNAIIEFLNQRYDEEEQAARVAGDAVGYSWIADGEMIVLAGGPAASDFVEGFFPEHGVEAAHIALHDPTRILLEVTAKRAIIEVAEPDTDGGYIDGWWNEHDRVLRLLAAPFSDHPDYREEWAA